MPKKFAEHGHAIQHFAEGVNFTTKAACHHFASELGGPLNNTIGPAEGGGHTSNNIAQATFAQARLVPTSCIRLSREGHGTILYFSLSVAQLLPPKVVAGLPL